jgi:hypothetical protein
MSLADKLTVHRPGDNCPQSTVDDHLGPINIGLHWNGENRGRILTPTVPSGHLNTLRSEAVLQLVGKTNKGSM